MSSEQPIETNLNHAENPNQELTNRGYDTAKKYRLDLHFGFLIGRGEHGNYQEKWPVKGIGRICKIQMVLAVLICALQISTLSFLRKYTILESWWTGIWSSLIVAMVANWTLWSHPRMTYTRYIAAMILQIMSVTGSALLLTSCLFYAIPSQRECLLAYYQTNTHVQLNYPYNRDDYEGQVNRVENGRIGLLASAFVATILMAFGGLFQLVLSLFLYWQSMGVICTRKFKMECSILAMDMKERNDELTTVTGLAEAKPPSYEEIIEQDQIESGSHHRF